MEKNMQKSVPKAGPTPILILVNDPKQSLYARNFYQDKILIRGLSKSL